MRIPALVLAVTAACSGGGGSAAPPPVETAFGFLLVRADAPTQRAVPIGNPLPGEAAVELAGPPTGSFVPAPGALPAVAPQAGALPLPVVFTPAGPGTASGEMRLKFSDVSTGARRDVILSLTAEVEEPSLRLLTPAVDFGSVRVGASASASVAVRNDSALTPLEVTSLSALPPGFIAGASLPRLLAAGETLTIPLRYEPAALGAPAFTLAIAHGGGVFDVDVAAQTDTWVERIVHDLGAVPLTAGQSEWLEVDVPPHAISLSIEALGPPGAVIALNGFEGPDGTVYEDENFLGAFLQTPNAEVFTATLPNSDRAEVQLVAGGGVYRFRFTLTSGNASALDVRAIVLNRPGGFVDAGQVDLNVFLADGLGVSPGDARLQALLQEVDRIFLQRGLRLGDVDYFDVTDPAFDDVTSDDEFGDLLEEAAAAPDARVNVFFVRTALGGGTLGVAARVAGPARNDTRFSGVMVDYDYGSDATAGLITAHEIGHYLGLYHTVEADGSHDLIDDTADCPANGTSAECPTAGNDYLMHWRALTGTDPVITAGQGRVILGHPLVDEVLPLSAIALRRPPAAAASGAVEELPPNWCGTKACGR